MRQEISPASVTLLGENPLTISSVEATASGLSEAARFFAYVGELAFVEAGPLNAEAWLRQNLPSGGSLSGGRGARPLRHRGGTRLRDNRHSRPGGRKRGLKNAGGGA